MYIEIVGPWVLLFLGAFLLAVAGVTILLGRPTQTLAFVFGLACAGVGTFGVSFLEPYGKWLKPILDMVNSPGVETYSQAFDRVGSGDLPPEFQEITLAYALDRPVEGMDGALDEAIDRAKDPSGREALEQVRAVIDGRAEVAEGLAEILARPRGTPGAELQRNASRIVGNLDPVTRSRLAKEIEKQPEETQRELRVDPNQMRETRDTFATIGR